MGGDSNSVKHGTYEEDGNLRLEPNSVWQASVYGGAVCVVQYWGDEAQVYNDW